jgi:hypothetical protein
MKNLQSDFSAFRVNGIGNRAVQIQICARIEHRRTFFHPPLQIRSEPSGKNKTGFATGARAEKFRQALDRTIQHFKASVHRAHHHTISQLNKAEIKRFEQMGVSGHVLP